MGSVGITTDGYLKPKTTIYGHGGTQSYTEQEVAELSGRKVYQHFHSPANDHNRFMSSRDPREKAIIRDTARPAPYTVQPNPWEPGTNILRPASAQRGGKKGAHGTKDMFPATHGEQAAAAAAGQEGGLIHKHLGSSVLRSYSKSPQRNVPQRTSAENSLAGSTQFGTPCFTIAATIKADLVEGKPVTKDVEHWRKVRVVSAPISPSAYGYGENGKRAAHQDYRYYKYYGFAGRGAKTSWGANPKARYFGNQLQYIRVVDVPPKPLEKYVAGPRRDLTPAEQAIVQDFPRHAYIE